MMVARKGGQRTTGRRTVGRAEAEAADRVVDGAFVEYLAKHGIATQDPMNSCALF